MWTATVVVSRVCRYTNSANATTAEAPPNTNINNSEIPKKKQQQQIFTHLSLSLSAQTHSSRTLRSTRKFNRAESNRIRGMMNNWRTSTQKTSQRKVDEREQQQNERARERIQIPCKQIKVRVLALRMPIYNVFC